ncbi:hypothetical protein PBRA_006020 [Plasmodiophora brassicae]|nr:hypothetical protein PBRA_006020 [Plasmodiophora brassicae]
MTSKPADIAYQTRVFVLLALSLVAYGVRADNTGGGGIVLNNQGGPTYDNVPDVPSVTVSPTASFLDRVRAEHGRHVESTYIRTEAQSWWPTSSDVQDKVVGAGRTLDRFFGRNISKHIIGMDTFDMVTMAITTSMDMKHMRGSGQVGRIHHCGDKRTLCFFLGERLRKDTWLNMYISMERFTLHVALKNITKGMPNGWSWRDVHAGVVGAFYPFAPFAPPILEVGGTLDFPRPKWVFGPGSDMGLGMYVLPGLTGFTGVVLGRGKWLRPFGQNFLHIENVQGSASLTWAFQPTAVSVGATMWIGPSNPDGTFTEENAIEVQAYLGVSIPSLHDYHGWFVLGKVSELTFDKLLHVLKMSLAMGKQEAKRRNVQSSKEQKMFGEVAGVDDPDTLPEPSPDAPQGERRVKKTFPLRKALSFLTCTGIRKVAISASARETATKFAIIPGGVRMQGIVNVLGYEAKAMLHIDTVWGFPVRVMMDFELDPVNLGPVVQIRRDKGSALGPKFYAEVGLPKVGAYMEGYVSVLGIGAHVVVAIDYKNVHFQVDGYLFGLVRASVMVAANNVDFRRMKDASFMAVVELELGTFQDLWDKTVRSIKGPWKWLKRKFTKKKKTVDDTVSLLKDGTAGEGDEDGDDDKTLAREPNKDEVAMLEGAQEDPQQVNRVLRGRVGLHKITTGLHLNVEHQSSLFFNVTYWHRKKGSNEVQYVTKGLVLDLSRLGNAIKTIFKGAWTALRDLFKKRRDSKKLDAAKTTPKRGIFSGIKGMFSPKSREPLSPASSNPRTLDMSQVSKLV